MSNDKFERKDIDRYLYEVAKIYKKQNKQVGAEAEIIIAGGAAMLLNYNFRNTTTDIDAVIRASSSFKDAINFVRDKFGLPNGWINSDFVRTTSYSSKIIEHSKYYKRFCDVLSVRTVEGEYLTAMKIKSARFYKKDLSDIIGIIKEHQEMGKPITFEKIDFAMNELYGGWEDISQGTKNYVMNILQSDDLENLYYAIIDEEEVNRDLLKEADKKYPKAMNADNVDVFLKSIRSKTEHRKESVLDKLYQNQEKVKSVPEGAIKEIPEIQEPMK